jgi:hypothetical protein
MPAIYMPMNIRLNVDETEFYIKTPQEMSRLEIAELEREIKALDDPVETFSGPNPDDEEDEEARMEALLKIPEYVDYQKQIRLLVPIRNGIIKRYFDKYKM